MALDEEDVRRIVREEIKKFMMEALELLPYVDEEEQREIEKIAGKPSDYEDGDFVEWDGE